MRRVDSFPVLACGSKQTYVFAPFFVIAMLMADTQTEDSQPQEEEFMAALMSAQGVPKFDGKDWRLYAQAPWFLSGNDRCTVGPKQQYLLRPLLCVSLRGRRAYLCEARRCDIRCGASGGIELHTGCS